MRPFFVLRIIINTRRHNKITNHTQATETRVSDQLIRFPKYRTNCFVSMFCIICIHCFRSGGFLISCCINKKKKIVHNIRIITCNMKYDIEFRMSKLFLFFVKNKNCLLFPRSSFCSVCSFFLKKKKKVVTFLNVNIFIFVSYTGVGYFPEDGLNIRMEFAEPR